MEANFTCNFCSIPATMFAIRDGNQVSVCHLHEDELTKKGLSLYGIDYINSKEDMRLYDRKKEEVAQGQKNIQLLLEAATREKSEALKRIEATEAKVIVRVKAIYDEMKRKVNDSSARILAELRDLESKFQPYLEKKEDQLPSLESKLTKWESINWPCLLQANITDPSVDICNSILKSYSHAQSPVTELLHDVYYDVERQARIKELLEYPKLLEKCTDISLLEEALRNCVQALHLQPSNLTSELMLKTQRQLAKVKREEAALLNQRIAGDWDVQLAVLTACDYFGQTQFVLDCRNEVKIRLLLRKGLILISPFAAMEETLPAFIKYLTVISDYIRRLRSLESGKKIFVETLQSVRSVPFTGALAPLELLFSKWSIKSKSDPISEMLTLFPDSEFSAIMYCSRINLTDESSVLSSIPILTQYAERFPNNATVLWHLVTASCKIKQNELMRKAYSGLISSHRNSYEAAWGTKMCAYVYAMTDTKNLDEAEVLYNRWLKTLVHIGCVEEINESIALLGNMPKENAKLKQIAVATRQTFM